MTKNELKAVLTFIKKYDLSSSFKDEKELNEWLVKLKSNQIENLIKFNIGPSGIKFPKKLLINLDLLNCRDYETRIKLMNDIKIEYGFSHLLDYLCSPNFLNSKNYYEDMKIMAEAENARGCLIVIYRKNFIKSKYHKEDLQLIVQMINEGAGIATVNALGSIASNENSINSPYHRKDMELVSQADERCIWGNHCYPKCGIDNLATSKESLKDKYHLDNMKLLMDYHNIDPDLYEMMTDHYTIKGKYYREEIKTWIDADSVLKRSAIYHHVMNCKNLSGRSFVRRLCDLDINAYSFDRDNCIMTKNKPHYIQNLAWLKNIDDKYVIFFESLMANKYLINSPYIDDDLKLISTVDNTEIFMSLYEVMSNQESLNSQYHLQDVKMISKISDNTLRNSLVRLATNKHSLASLNHSYDMDYLSKLNLKTIDKEIRKEIESYLFYEKGINHPMHKYILEQLAKDIIVKTDCVLDYINDLENNIDNIEEIDFISAKKKKGFAKIKSLLMRK